MAFARREEVNKEVASIGRDVRLLAQKDNKVRSNLEIKLRRREEMEAEFENRQTKIAKLERELEALHQDAEQLPDAKDAEVKFELGVIQNEDGVDEISYKPVLNAQYLASHLQEEISFEQNFAPIFLGQIVQDLRNS